MTDSQRWQRLPRWPGLGLALALSLWLSGCATTAPPQAQAPVQTPPASMPAASSPEPSAVASPVTPSPAPAAQTSPSADSGATVTFKAQPSLGLQPPNDIWERIRRGFAMPDLQGPLVREGEQWYAAKPEYMLRMTERSRRYIFHIVEELERRKMPTELALLPFIESAFNPVAVSSAKAAGLWQFMPATGKSFDLKQNLFRDERRDVLESTRAALDYLQRLYGMFGDWHLALAAYNWGEGSVGRALARNKAQGKPLNYSDLSMPNETRNYVPRLQAVKNIIAMPEAFKVELPRIRNHPYFQSVAIVRDIDVNLAARLAEISLDDFKALNPSMNRPVILASGTPQILLPWDNAKVFERNLRDHAGQRLATWTAWVAPRTMKPEDAAQEVGMPVEQLRSANSIPARMMVKAGSTLLVHRKGGLDSDVSEHMADKAQLSLAPELVLKRITVTARKGDTLSSLAARYGVSAANMASWNKLPAVASLKGGQSLVVLVPSEGARRAPKASAPSASGKARKAAPVQKKKR